MHRMTANFFFDHAGALPQFSGDKREINFLDSARCELFRQSAMGFVILRDDDAAARVFIEAMNDAGTFFSANSGKI